LKGLFDEDNEVWISSFNGLMMVVPSLAMQHEEKEFSSQDAGIYDFKSLTIDHIVPQLYAILADSAVSVSLKIRCMTYFFQLWNLSYENVRLKGKPSPFCFYILMFDLG
jgi:hypothetical protein